MGHGRCETFNKQTPLAGPNGRATSDSKNIAVCAIKLLRAFNFDPKELRGISIQIQKLEKMTDSTAPIEPGQARLSFKSAPKTNTHASDELPEPPNLPKPLASATELQPLEEDVVAGVQDMAPPTWDYPTFSQVDLGVLQELPPDVRAEIEADYARKAQTNATSTSMESIPARQPSPAPEAGPSRFKLTVKGTTTKKTIQQLALKNGSSTSRTKNSIFAKRDRSYEMDVSDVELRRLDIDPEIFRALPSDLQREQLALQRHLKAGGTITTVVERKVLKPTIFRPNTRSRSPSIPRPCAPPPHANIPEPPALKQQVRGPDGEKRKIRYTEAEDVQGLIERWVNGFRQAAPSPGDVEFFAQFLLKCMDSGPGKGTDVGIEKAIQVVKWWLVLLRRHWGAWEQDMQSAGDTDESVHSSEAEVARAWWRAFRDVKARMDVVARKRFGGSLSLR
jgi:DNA repair protein REV1